MMRLYQDRWNIKLHPLIELEEFPFNKKYSHETKSVKPKCNEDLSHLLQHVSLYDTTYNKVNSGPLIKVLATPPPDVIKF